MVFVLVPLVEFTQTVVNRLVSTAEPGPDVLVIEESLELPSIQKSYPTPSRHQTTQFHALSTDQNKKVIPKE